MNKSIDIPNNINDLSNNDNYYFLRDIKSKKLIKCKGLFEIIHSPEELFLIAFPSGYIEYDNIYIPLHRHLKLSIHLWA